MSSKVLLAGSDRLLQQMANTFDAGQIHTLFADDGYAALCLLNETTPDLLIAEIALPDKDGYALCRYIKQEPEFQSLPVVLVDNQFNDFNQRLAFSAGADVYLSQPLQADELIDIVYKLLDAKAAAEAEDDEALPFAQTAATRRPSIALDADDSLLPSAMQEAAQRRPAQPAIEEQTVPLPPSPPHRPDYLLFSVVGITAILIGIGLAVLLQTHTQGLQTSQQSSSSDKPLQEGALAMAGQPYGTASASEAQTGTSAEAASLPAPIRTTKQGEREAAAPTAQPDAEVSPNAPNDTAKAEARQDEPPTSTAASTARRTDSPAAGGMRPLPSRPRSVRSTTRAGHWRRGGQEMTEAGEHFGSGAKHFSQGSANAAVWAGKKAGGGVKRIGMAIKRLF
jgi:twitching motility two-component system response regulator PilH